MSIHSGVVVVGSANLDTVFRAERTPQPGETLLADSVARYPGGKGLNQAVAAARAGAATTFVSAVGSDGDGDALVAVATAAGIDTTLVRRADESTGQAFIVVDSRGENSIIVASGANGHVLSLHPADVAAIGAASVVLMQLELPIAVVTETARLARSLGTLVMLNAAPAQPLPDDLLDDVDYLIVNEHEARLVAGLDALGTAAASLAARVPRLVVTLGSDGCRLYEAGRELAPIEALRVTAVDTTGAGDTFCGALAARVAGDDHFAVAALFATAAGALSVQSAGAVPSIPTKDAVLRLLALGH